MYTQTASHDDHHTPTGGNVGLIQLTTKILVQCI